MKRARTRADTGPHAPEPSATAASAAAAAPPAASAASGDGRRAGGTTAAATAAPPMATKTRSGGNCSSDVSGVYPTTGTRVASAVPTA